MDLNFRNFLPFVNMQVDFVKPDSNNKIFIKGVVRAVEATSDGAHLMIEPTDSAGGANSAVAIYWPSDDIDFCGEKVKGEKCNNDSVRPDKSGLFDSKICFNTKNDATLNK